MTVILLIHSILFILSNFFLTSDLTPSPPCLRGEWIVVWGMDCRKGRNLTEGNRGNGEEVFLFSLFSSFPSVKNETKHGISPVFFLAKPRGVLRERTEVFGAVQGYVIGVVRIVGIAPGGAAGVEDVVAIEKPVNILEGMVLLVRMAKEDGALLPVDEVVRGQQHQIIASCRWIFLLIGESPVAFADGVELNNELVRAAGKINLGGFSP